MQIHIKTHIKQSQWRPVSIMIEQCTSALVVRMGAIISLIVLLLEQDRYACRKEQLWRNATSCIKTLITWDIHKRHRLLLEIWVAAVRSMRVGSNWVEEGQYRRGMQFSGNALQWHAKVPRFNPQQKSLAQDPVVVLPGWAGNGNLDGPICFSCVFILPSSQSQVPRNRHASGIVVRSQARTQETWIQIPIQPLCSISDLMPITLSQTNLSSRIGEGSNLKSLEGKKKMIDLGPFFWNSTWSASL